MKIALRILISAVIFLSVFYFAPLIISSSTLIRSINGNTPLIFSEFCFLIFSLLIIAFLSKCNFKEFGFRYGGFGKYWFPIVLVLFVYGAIIIFKFFLNISRSYDINISIIELFLFYTLLPSLSEEIFIRGLLQSFLGPLKPLGLVLFKIRLSLPVLISIIFLFFYFTNIAFIGFLTAYYREKTGSVLPCILIHLVVNILNGFIPPIIF